MPDTMCSPHITTANDEGQTEFVIGGRWCIVMGNVLSIGTTTKPRLLYAQGRFPVLLNAAPLGHGERSSSWGMGNNHQRREATTRPGVLHAQGHFQFSALIVANR